MPTTLQVDRRMSAASTDPPDWFWEVLDSTRPDLWRLEAWLMLASRRQVERFAAEFEAAAAAICDYWNGPLVDDLQYSEDDTEDLCNWLVAQGREAWQRVIAGQETLADAARRMTAEERDGSPARWTSAVSDPEHEGYQSPWYIAYGVYRSRFGESLHDRLA